MTGYTAGMLNERVTIILPGTHTDGDFGRDYIPGERLERWAAVDWSRGTKALREGAVDAYDTIMVRMRFDERISRDCKVEHDGRTYRIDSLHASRKNATIQMTCTELSES
jgi:SPP1 family predicted phage head-tail adaptor